LERQLDWAKGEVDGPKSVVAALTKERNELGSTLASVSDALETVRKAAHAPKDVVLAEAVAKLRLERDEAKQRAAEEEYRGRDWMVRCEDAEAEVERLKKALNETQCRWQTPGDFNALAKLVIDPDVDTIIRAYTEADTCFEFDSTELADVLRDRHEEPVSTAPDFSPTPEMMPTAHAEKVLVAVAKAAAQVGAEEEFERCLLLVAKLAAAIRAEGRRAPDRETKSDWALCLGTVEGALDAIRDGKVMP
jgi:hypothetical protein